jgi:cell division protein FtsB
LHRGAVRGTANRGRVARRKPPRRKYLLRWLAVGAIVLVALLYARPLRSYLNTKHELAQRRADVQALIAEKRELQQRLADASTPEALQRQARRLGLVRPGERLFIVKGITAWLHSKATIGAGG